MAVGSNGIGVCTQRPSASVYRILPSVKALRPTPRQAPGYCLAELDSEILLYHPVKTKTVYLNDTAALVWGLCDGRRTTCDIIELLRDAFPNSVAVITDEIEWTLDQLARSGVCFFAACLPSALPARHLATLPEGG